MENNKDTKVKEKREIVLRAIQTVERIKKNKREGKHHIYQITKENTSWEELKAMYDKRVIKYRLLENELNLLKESKKTTKLDKDSQTLQDYCDITREIILECDFEYESVIIGSFAAEYMGAKDRDEELRVIKKYRQWVHRNPELYGEIFYDTMNEEYKRGNIKRNPKELLDIIKVEF